MSTALQHKLSHCEVLPPGDVWEKLAVQLDSVFDPVEISLSVKLTDTAITPPSSTWEFISAEINNNQQQKLPARIIPMFYRRLAVAVIVAGIVSVSVMYLFNNSFRKEGLPAAQNTPAVSNKNHVADQPSGPEAAAGKPLPESTASRKTPLAANRIIKSSAGYRTKNIQRTYPSTDITYASVPEMQAADMMNPISVSAPPIRDERGNIIMDVGLISSPNSPHIVVTGPNGAQTKISNKFLHCLSYLNGDISAGETNMEGLKWKTRFQEWKNKLLSEAAFIPSANNFFDIFELKDMIEERPAK